MLRLKSWVVHPRRDQFPEGNFTDFPVSPFHFFHSEVSLTLKQDLVKLGTGFSSPTYRLPQQYRNLVSSTQLILWNLHLSEWKRYFNSLIYFIMGWYVINVFRVCFIPLFLQSFLGFFTFIYKDVYDFFTTTSYDHRLFHVKFSSLH